MPEKFDPSRELNNLRSIVGRVLEQGVQTVQSIGGGSLRLDVYEVEDTLIVRTSAIDGVVPDSIEVNMENNVLTISGDTRPEPTPVNANFIVQERRFGPFSRSITINIPVRSAEAKAKLKDGALTITFPIDRSQPVDIYHED
ncbi:Hsp20/alpha crystallin family protein [Aggregatilineales bacterium SYSU G02658]